MKKIISTVGTSIFENFSAGLGKKNGTFKQAYTHDEVGLKKKDLAYKDWDNISDSVSQNRKDIKIAIKESTQFWNGKNASAEIRSIIEICDQETDTEFETHLIATDTVLSVLAAELICEWFNRTENIHKPNNLKNCYFFRPKEPENFKIQSNELYVIKDLRVDSKTTFEKGFMNLVEVLNKLIEKDKTILNITGGYKAIIPIVTLLGQIKEVPLKYIYNDSDLKDNENPLIEIGNLPFSFDWDYIYHWELLIRQSSLDYISPIFSALRDLKKAGKLEHQHLQSQQEFKDLTMIQSEKTKILKKENRGLLSIYEKIVLEKVLIFENNTLKPTILGSLLQKYADKKQLVGSSRMGGLVELFCFKFFATPPAQRYTSETDSYILNLNPTFEATKYAEDIANNSIIIDTIPGRDAKDVDIHLINTSTNAIVLGECKTVWAFIEKSKKHEYLNQIKARVLKQLQINQNNLVNQNIEFLFIAVNFESFSNLDFADENECYQEVSDAVIVFSELEKDAQIQAELNKFSPPIRFKLNTMYFRRKLKLESEAKVDWNYLFLNVINPNPAKNKEMYNNVIII